MPMSSPKMTTMFGLRRVPLPLPLLDRLCPLPLVDFLWPLPLLERFVMRMPLLSAASRCAAAQVDDGAGVESLTQGADLSLFQRSARLIRAPRGTLHAADMTCRAPNASRVPRCS